MIWIKEILNGQNFDKIIIFEEALCDLSIFSKDNELELYMGDILYMIEEILIIFQDLFERGLAYSDLKP